MVDTGIINWYIQVLYTGRYRYHRLVDTGIIHW